MDYENAYKELVKSLNCVLELKSVKESGTIPVDDVRKLIPELNESENERIKRCIQVALTDVDENRFNDYDTTLKDCLAWLEKQGEKSINKVEPKFKVGDWVINNNGEPQISQVISRSWPDSKIKGATNNLEMFINTSTLDKQYHLWTIQDVKDGDVLYHKSPLTGIEYIVMSRGVNGYGTIDSYFRYNSDYGFDTDIPSVFSAKLDDITPATKEQRDILFQKMHEAGYEWDDEEKELRKIEQVSVWSEDDKKLIENKNKLIDKVREKFTIGDWIINKDKIPTLIRSVYFDGYKTTRGCINYHTLDEEYRLWSIQDAKEGDVLEFQKDSEFVIGITSFINKNTGNIDMCCLLEDDNFKVGSFNNLHAINVYPARKEQIEKLFIKMKEAGYEWDSEKKGLKMIKPDFQKIQWKGNNLKEIVEFTGKSPKFNDWFKTWEEYENYVHAHNNIFKLFNEDGSHFEVPVGAWIVKTPDEYIVASKSTFIQRHTWSEEDEKNWRHCLHYIDAYVTPVKEHVDWFKNIRNRIQHQPKQEWSEEDEKNLNNIIFFLNEFNEVYHDDAQNCIEWIKSLKPNHWKPSEEQLRAIINSVQGLYQCKEKEILLDLYEQLKNL